MPKTEFERITEKKIKAALWKRGELSFLLDKTQIEMKTAFYSSDSRKFTLLCSRRLGKSYLLCVIAAEFLLKNPGKKIVYVTNNFKAAKNIVRPLMSQIVQDCPASIRPRFLTQDMKFVWPSGSELFLYGADRDPDNCRGQEADLILIDEAGFVDKLDYLVGSVLTPMLLMTNGRILMATTPSKDVEHPFLPMLEESMVKGTVVKKTIHDCPRVTPKMLAEYMEEAGGEHSENWRREYLCEVVRSQEKTVIPEFDEIAQIDSVKEIPIIPHRDLYVAMDLGFVDMTGALFGYIDFIKGVAVVEDEILINRENTENIAKMVSGKERSLWGGQPPYKRVSDSNDPQFIYDLSTLHKLTFTPDPKIGVKEQRVNKLRLMVQQRTLIIHPRCKNLIAQMIFAKWKGNDRLTFERSPNHSHYDLVDALIIFVNSLEWGRNPVPRHFDIHTQYPEALKPTNNQLQNMMPFTTSKIRRRF